MENAATQMNKIERLKKVIKKELIQQKYETN